MTRLTVTVGGTLEDDLSAFVGAWHRAEHGEIVADHVLAFENWEELAQVMTGERFRLLRHLHAHPEPSVSALGRQYRRVHADIIALEVAGLLERTPGEVRATADRITAELQLAS